MDPERCQNKNYTTPTPRTPTSPLSITLIPERDGTTSVIVSMGDTSFPKVTASLDWRLAGFVADLQALARAKLLAVKAPAITGAADDNPAIAVDGAHGEQVR